MAASSTIFITSCLIALHKTESVTENGDKLSSERVPVEVVMIETSPEQVL
jgi:hypothetical protein